ncbi:MAG: FAD-dependent oxidoreductase [Planctomycetota bacterium]
MTKPFILSASLCFLASLFNSAAAESLFLEAEAFEDHGGWKLDTQFIDNMGSPYLLAHGLGQPVEDSVTKVRFPATGTYHVFVRTKDWVARWDAPGAPGKFQVIVGGETLDEAFGTEGKEWGWQAGGTIEIDDLETEVRLHDLTGFNGRCDAIYFSQSPTAPPSDSETLAAWRQEQLGLDRTVEIREGYDLVVIGGGYAGMGSAISAARSGCKVALIQNRGVLGGNGSSEVRVWAMGLIRRGKYPRIGEMIEEISDNASKSPGTYEEFEDEKKERVVRAEPNIDLFLHHHANKVKTNAGQIEEVEAFDTRSGQRVAFRGTLFADCTGHGTIGALAGADNEMTPKGRMGMSNMWAWDEAAQAKQFPETPWALDLNMDDFPYPRDHHGQWFWESGFDKDPLGDAEGIRDWNLRAVFGAFNAMKNRDGAAEHKTAFLTWVAYIGGPRESRRLMGDVVLNQDDILAKRDFPDGCVPSTWSIDLHYPKEQFAKKYPDNPFISVAEHDRRVDRAYGYPVPYRCFYSRNIENLFMAGRNVSVTHEALGTVRVMKTCGMMGEVVGRAASICVAHDCLPNRVYPDYWSEMDEMLQLPGKAFRKTVDDEWTIPDDAFEIAGIHGPPSGVDPKKLSGLVLDDKAAKTIGDWKDGQGLKPFVGYGYRYAPADSGAKLFFEAKLPSAGKYRLRVAHQPHKNRGKSVPIRWSSIMGDGNGTLDMSVPPADEGFTDVGTIEVTDVKREVFVAIESEGAGGVVHADAIQFVKIQ